MGALALAAALAVRSATLAAGAALASEAGAGAKAEAPAAEAPIAGSPLCDELSAGLDLKNLPSSDRREFCAFAKDAVAGGCCQSTLYDCLKTKPTCARGQVLAEVGKGVIQTGATEEKAVAAAADYEAGFAPEKRTPLDPAKAPCRGPKDGLLLVEFSDFDCPHCALAQPLVDQLLAKDKQVRFCAFTFPLPGHHFSQLASAAALYAESQGKYWPMAEALFASQAEREAADEGGYKAQLVKVGKAVGLEGAKLLEALKPESAAMEKVKENLMLGISLPIQGTPTFFVDGREIKGLPLTALATAVRDERESKGKK